jgi:hypothetical protein
MAGWLELGNKILLIAILLLLCTAGIVAIWPEREISHSAHRTRVLPALALTKEAEERYAPINGPLFALQYVPPVVQLPNLANEFVFYGMDKRPDALPDERSVHLAIRGELEVSTFPINQPIYLQLQKSESEGNYLFLPKGSESPLWVVPQLSEEEGRLALQVRMRCHDGEIVDHPQQHATIVLNETPYGRIPQQSWTVGPHRADNSLLARLRCSWVGEDRLLEELGESNEVVHRLDFGDLEEAYSCFISPQTTLYWDKERWHQAPADFDTRPYPILKVSEIEDRLLHLEVWNVQGKGHLNLSLLRSRESWQLDSMISSLRVLGARSWSRLILEAGQQRLEVSPNDWLFYEESRWHKLSTPEEIDAVVARRKAGELMIIDKVERKEGRTLLIARIYNKTRSEVKQLELQLTQSTNPSSGGHEMADSRPTRPQLQSFGIVP